MKFNAYVVNDRNVTLAQITDAPLGDVLDFLEEGVDEQARNMAECKIEPVEP